MFPALAQLNAAVWVLIVLVYVAFAPMISVYVVIRVLRDLRRIANALDRAAPQAAFLRPSRPASNATRASVSATGVSLSAFGR